MYNAAVGCEKSCQEMSAAVRTEYRGQMFQCWYHGQHSQQVSPCHRPNKQFHGSKNSLDPVSSENSWAYAKSKVIAFKNSFESVKLENSWLFMAFKNSWTRSEENILGKISMCVGGIMQGWSSVGKNNVTYSVLNKVYQDTLTLLTGQQAQCLQILSNPPWSQELASEKIKSTAAARNLFCGGDLLGNVVESGFGL